MKILILANMDVGLYKFRKELIEELLNQGNEVYISLPNGKLVSKLEDLGCHFIDTDVDRRGINPKTDMKLLNCYRKMIKQIRPDLVITYTIKPNIYGGMVCRLIKIPYATNITGLGTAFQNNGLLKKIVVFLYRIALKKAKVVFFENVENMETIIKHKIIKREQACLLNGAGVNLEEYTFCQYPETGDVHFLFIGRIMKEKGVDELFEVAEKIRKENENVFLDIVGPMEDDYKERVETLANKGVINYHGYQEDVKPFIQNSHCFVLPSYHEGMANTLLESAAMGRPLITSDIHGCKEAVVEGENGYLVKKSSSEDLYQKMKQFLRLNFQEKGKMGIESRRHMEQVFDKKKVVIETVSKLKE